MSIFTLCFAYQIIRIVHASECDIQADSLINRNVMLDGFQFWNSKTHDIGACARSCVRRNVCGSFNFDLRSRNCELNSETMITQPGSRVAYATSVYSDISKWPTALDPACHGRPCASNEVCVPATLTSGTSCHYHCLKLKHRCPTLAAPLSSSTFIGSVATFTCTSGHVGGGSATCLPTSVWSNEINTTCVPLLGHTCTTDADCAAIEADCIDSKCACPDTHAYIAADFVCKQLCDMNQLSIPTNGKLGFSSSTNGLSATFTCKSGYTPEASVITICQDDTTWSVLSHICTLKDCRAMFEAGITTDGIYEIVLDDTQMVNAWCDMKGGGWTVFQHREDGSLDFKRDYAEYAAGFGDPSGEHWLGLDKLHLLTHVPSELNISMTTFGDEEPINGYATYSTFNVGDPTSNYRLTIDGFSGNCDDAMEALNGQEFSAINVDNDAFDTTDCAQTYEGGWWYNRCGPSNLNGLYHDVNEPPSLNGIWWFGCYPWQYSLKQTVMKLRHTA